MKPDKREMILRAAGKVFGEKGFHLATVEEIAKEAGVGKGTIYQYFDSKSDIVTQLHMWFVQRYLEALDTVLDEMLPFADNCRQILSIHVEHMLELTPMVTKIHQEVVEMKIDKCEAVNAFRQVEERLMAMVQRGIDRGELRSIEPQIVVACLESILLGATHSAIATGKDLQETADCMLELIMYGISNEQAARSPSC